MIQRGSRGREAHSAPEGGFLGQGPQMDHILPPRGAVLPPLHEADDGHHDVIEVQAHHPPAPLHREAVGAGRAGEDAHHPHRVLLENLQDDVGDTGHQGENFYDLNDCHLSAHHFPRKKVGVTFSISQPQCSRLLLALRLRMDIVSVPCMNE